MAAVALNEMTASENELLLNEAQKNSLAVTLRLLEERILFLRYMVRERRIEGILFQFDNNFSEQERERLERKFEQLLETIQVIKDTFDLPQKAMTLSAMVNVFSSHFWSLLLDEKSPALKRYGQVDAQLAKVLDPLIDRLIHLLSELDGLRR